MSVHDSFPCSDCKCDFPTAEIFSDHFIRFKDKDGIPTITITGCSTTRRAERAAN